MSSKLFSCPLPAALPAVSDTGECFSSPGNVIGIGFQLYQSTPSFDATTVKAVGTYTPLLASTSDTALRYVPVVNFVAATGEAITEGGNDQTTYLGIPKMKGGGFSTATFTLEGITAAQALEVRNLIQFSRLSNGRTKLRAVLFTEDNFVITASDFNGVPVHGLYISDVIKGGSFKPEDMYNGQFYLPYGWSHDSVTTLATFDVASLLNVAP